MSFLSLSSAWLFLLLAPLVLFYFLKLKRPRLEIPSLVLWRQVLSDQRVNSPFQKFKRNLLLLLQIILLALLVLAAMQPFLRREAAHADRLPVLIDVSASMGARTIEGSPTRLEEAKQRVRALIDGLLPEQQLCLVAFSKSARRLTPFTDNQRELRQALEALAVEDLPSDLEEALRMAQALARSTAFEKVMLFSDGNFPARTRFELSFAIDYQRLAAGGQNFGIVSCNARRVPGGEWEIFVQLASSVAAESTAATLELRQDGAIVATENVALVKGATPRLSFRLATNQPSTIECRLTTNGFDAMPADNAAWLSLPATRPLAIHVPLGLASYRQALKALEDVRVFPAQDQSSPAAFDLVITDAEADLALPARTRCTLGLIPAELRASLALEKRNGTAIDWRRDAALLQHISLGEVIFMDSPIFLPGAQEEALANLGYEVLAHAASGPLVLEKREGELLAVHLLFHPERSTLPYRVGFPIFVSNLVQTALKQAELSEANGVQTGVLPPLTLAPNRAYRIQGPGGFEREESTDERGRLSGIAAPRAGEYVIATDGAEQLRVGASLLSASESALGVVEQIEFNDQLTVAAATSAAKSDRSLWWALALAGFLVLLVEWWFFQRPRISRA